MRDYSGSLSQDGGNGDEEKWVCMIDIVFKKPQDSFLWLFGWGHKGEGGCQRCLPGFTLSA